MKILISTVMAMLVTFAAIKFSPSSEADMTPFLKGCQQGIQHDHPNVSDFFVTTYCDCMAESYKVLHAASNEAGLKCVSAAKQQAQANHIALYK